MIKNTKKINEITHPFAYLKGEKYNIRTAEQEDIRIKQGDLVKPTYYSYSTDEELELISGFQKKKLNKKTGEPIKVKAHFKRKDRAAKGTVKSITYKEDGNIVTSGESLLHQIAKQCFKINVPFRIIGITADNKLYNFNQNLIEKYELLSEDSVIIINVEIEKVIKLLDEHNNEVIKRPDVKITCYHLNTGSTFDLYVEIAVKHKKTQADIEIFKYNNLNLIEIDISSLISLVSRISENNEEGTITPDKFLNIVNATVLTDVSKQTWLSSKIIEKYVKDIQNIRVYNIEKCGYRELGQEGMLGFKCSTDGYGQGTRTIVNLACTKCKNCVGILGDYEYIQDVNKTRCEGLPYIVCCKKPELINKETMELNVTRGYENL